MWEVEEGFDFYIIFVQDLGPLTSVSPVVWQCRRWNWWKDAGSWWKPHIELVRREWISLPAMVIARQHQKGFLNNSKGHISDSQLNYKNFSALARRNDQRLTVSVCKWLFQVKITFLYFWLFWWASDYLLYSPNESKPQVYSMTLPSLNTQSLVATDFI